MEYFDFKKTQVITILLPFRLCFKIFNVFCCCLIFFKEKFCLFEQKLTEISSTELESGQKLSAALHNRKKEGDFYQEDTEAKLGNWGAKA